MKNEPSELFRKNRLPPRQSPYNSGFDIPCLHLEASGNNTRSNRTDTKHKMSGDMTKPIKWVCAQWRLRSAWASAQSDQSSLRAEWVHVAKYPSFLHADSEESAQSDLSLRWAHSHFVGFVMSWFSYAKQGDQVPVILTRKRYIYPKSPKLFSKALNVSKTGQNVWILWVCCLFSNTICVTRQQILSECGIYDANLNVYCRFSLQPRKMVTLANNKYRPAP